MMSKELLQSVARGALFSVVAMGLVSLTPISAVAQDAGTSPNGQVQVPPASATQDIPGVDPKALVDGPLSPDAPALQYLRSRGNVLRFMGRLHGLDAYFAKAANGSIQTFYISPDGNAAIAGLMFNIQGQNITMGQVTSLLQSDPAALADANTLLDTSEQANAAKAPLTPQQQQAKAEAVLNVVDRTNWFRLGVEDAPVVYMVHDPNCPWCERAMQYLAPQIAQGQIQLRVIPVGLLADTSLAKAAAIISAPNPGEALQRYEGRAKSPPPAQTVSQDAILLIRQNEQFTRDYELEGTPHFVFRGFDGIPRIIRGMPRNMPGDLIRLVRGGA
ncbi:MAG TPA: thiol:disulfide interchange protein DsbG [Rhodospirillaceae bacterium]|nr:thiol:disulfide interchange protein DsbG [Alphaproteobacteria bacterium]HCI47795.1 thiol:disulfide interchange protein DsbG [Rhodospirillaceae bacterium]